MKYKSYLLKISALLLFVLLITSCGKKKLPKNYFKVGEDVFELSYGNIINNGQVDGGFDVDLRLYCENGKDFINFSLVVPQAENIPSTTYRTFDASWVIGYNNGSYTNMGNINSGSVVVDRSSQGYVIEIECVDQYSNEVEGHYKGELRIKDENNLVVELPDYIVPEEIYNELTEYFPVYSGVTPPEVEGEYVSSPHVLVYENNGETSDSVIYYSDRYVGFMYSGNQLNFYGKQYDSESGTYLEEIQYGVKITGEDDNFSCYYVVDGYPGGYYAQQSFIFSGKKTDEGLENFHVAVVLLETSGNPDLQPKNTFRVLKDEDGLAEANSWLSKSAGRAAKNAAGDWGAFEIWRK